MKIAADQECFVCGPKNPIGLKADFSVDYTTNSSEAELFLSEQYQGWQGVVHGGIISTLLDEAAIYACRPVSLHAVTTSLTVRFRKPLSTGVEVKVKAEIIEIRRHLATVASTLSFHGEVMAEAEVKVMLLDHKKEILS